MKTFKILKERGYIYQCSNLDEVIKKLNGEEKVTFYFGIDPTADSLHIGHFFALTMVRRMQDMGHKPIIVVGGATALIGDPTGKTDMRTILTKEQVDHNKKEVKELVKRFVKIDGEYRELQKETPPPRAILDTNLKIANEDLKVIGDLLESKVRVFLLTR